MLDMEKETWQLPQKMEEVWSKAGPLPDTQRLNSAFENVQVSSFPDLPHGGQVIEVDADANLEDAVRLLAHNCILSAPVRKSGAPAGAGWKDRYIGIVDFPGIILWILNQSEAAKTGMIVGAVGSGALAAGVIATLGGIVAGATALGTAGGAVLVSAVVGAGFGATAAAGPAKSGPEAVGALGVNFFEALTASDFYKETKVADITGSYRWAPFIPVKKGDSLLTVLLLLSHYRMKSLPVVEEEGQIQNFITQSDVINFLSHCSGFKWFESVGSRTLLELRLPLMQPDEIVKLEEDSPILEAFRLMKEKDVGGVPVVATGTMKLIGNISASDVHFLLSTPEIFKSCSTLTAKSFLEAAKNHLHSEGSVDLPLLDSPPSCSLTDTLTSIIKKLEHVKAHRMYVVDSEGALEGIVTLRDIISTFVEEPLHHFDDFFADLQPPVTFL